MVGGSSCFRNTHGPSLTLASCMHKCTYQVLATHDRHLSYRHERRCVYCNCRGSLRRGWENVMSTKYNKKGRDTICLPKTFKSVDGFYVYQHRNRALKLQSHNRRTELEETPAHGGCPETFYVYQSITYEFCVAN